MKNAIIILLVLVVLGFGGYTFYNQAQPDYAYQPSAVQPVLNAPDNSFTTKPAPAVDETANWKTYKNEQFGFEFKYPNTLTDIKVSNNMSCSLSGDAYSQTEYDNYVADNDLSPLLNLCVVATNDEAILRASRSYQSSSAKELTYAVGGYTVIIDAYNRVFANDKISVSGAIQDTFRLIP